MGDGILRKHGVTFEEAASVFRDVLSVTISDALHSTEERSIRNHWTLRFETEPWSWYPPKSGRRFESSARDSQPDVNGESMRKVRPSSPWIKSWRTAPSRSRLGKVLILQSRARKQAVVLRRLPLYPRAAKE